MEDIVEDNSEKILLDLLVENLTIYSVIKVLYTWKMHTKSGWFEPILKFSA
jgi:hypothetical protein